MRVAPLLEPKFSELREEVGRDAGFLPYQIPSPLQVPWLSRHGGCVNFIAIGRGPAHVPDNCAVAVTLRTYLTWTYFRVLPLNSQFHTFLLSRGCRTFLCTLFVTVVVY